MIAKPRIIDKKLGIMNKFHKNIDSIVSLTQKDVNSTPETLQISELMNKKNSKKNEWFLPLINEHKKVLKPAIFVLENTKNFMTSEQRKKLVLSASYRDITKKRMRSMIRKTNGEVSLEQSQDRVMETPEIFNFKGVTGQKRGIYSANCFANFQIPHSTSQIPQKFEL